MSTMSKQMLAKSLENDEYLRELCTSALSRVLRDDLRSRCKEKKDDESKKEPSNLIASLIDALGDVMANRGQDRERVQEKASSTSSTGYDRLHNSLRLVFDVLTMHFLYSNVVTNQSYLLFPHSFPDPKP